MRKQKFRGIDEDIQSHNQWEEVPGSSPRASTPVFGVSAAVIDILLHFTSGERQNSPFLKTQTSTALAQSAAFGSIGGQYAAIIPPSSPSHAGHVPVSHCKPPQTALIGLGHT